MEKGFMEPSLGEPRMIQQPLTYGKKVLAKILISGYSFFFLGGGVGPLAAVPWACGISGACSLWLATVTPTPNFFSRGGYGHTIPIPIFKKDLSVTPEELKLGTH